jgi:hypothetical protein
MFTSLDEKTSIHSEIDLEKYKEWMKRHPEIDDPNQEVNFTDSEHLP